jgi:hypothetical protein
MVSWLDDHKRAFLSGLWLLVLPLAALALQVGLGAYCRHAQAVLDWQLSLAQVVPDMVAELAVARNTTRGIALTPEQGDSIVETLGTKLHNLVQRDGFRLDSLFVEKSGVVNGMSQFRVALNGAGDVPAIATFLHAVQSSERLLCLDYVRLTSHKVAEENSFAVELAFRYLVIPP